MNPSGADGGNLLPTDWNYDPIYIYSHPSIGVAVPIGTFDRSLILSTRMSDLLRVVLIDEAMPGTAE